MEQNITELQKRRADNIIWTCADDYSFAPDFKAYDSSGDADIYWNIIFGAARRHYEYDKLEALFAMLDKYRDAAVYESLFWSALEPILFRAELSERPVLEKMRPAPAETELKLGADMTTDEIVAEARRFFLERYGLCGDGKIRLQNRLRHPRRMSVDSFLQRGPIFAHEKGLYHGDISGWRGDFVQSFSRRNSADRSIRPSRSSGWKKSSAAAATGSRTCFTRRARSSSSAAFTAPSSCIRDGGRRS